MSNTKPAVMSLMDQGCMLDLISMQDAPFTQWKQQFVMMFSTNAATPLKQWKIRVKSRSLEDLKFVTDLNVKHSTSVKRSIHCMEFGPFTSITTAYSMYDRIRERILKDLTDINRKHTQHT